MKKTISIVVLAMFALLMAAPWARADDQGKVKLRLNLEKGYRHKQVMNIEQDITQDIQGQKQQIKQNIGYDWIMTATEVADNGDVTLDIRYTAARMKMDAGVMVVDYDSDRDGQQVPHPAAAGFSGLVGNGFQVIISTTGELKDVKGIDQLMDGIIRNLQMPEGPMRDQIVADFKKQFNDKSMAGMIKPMFEIYPEEAVGVGDSWNKEMTIPNPMMTMAMKNTWKVQSRDKGQMTTKVDTSITTAEQDKPLKMGESEVKFDLKGTQTGETVLDEKTGITLSATMNQDLSGTFHMLAPMQMDIPMTIRSRTTIKTVPLDEE